MADLPMHYTTRYRREGPAAEGVLSIEQRPDLPAGSPHDLDRYSPEHLLLAAAEVCMANYVALIAARSEVELLGYASRADGELEFVPKAGYCFKRIVIRPEVEVGKDDESRIERIIDKAHRACLIARSLNCPVDIEADVQTR